LKKEIPIEERNSYIMNSIENTLEHNNVELVINPSLNNKSINILYADGTILEYQGGGHVMSVVGVTDENHIIVASWGNKYTIDINELYNINCGIYKVSIK